MTEESNQSNIKYYKIPGIHLPEGAFAISVSYESEVGTAYIRPSLNFKHNSLLWHFVMGEGQYAARISEVVPGKFIFCQGTRNFSISSSLLNKQQVVKELVKHKGCRAAQNAPIFAFLNNGMYSVVYECRKDVFKTIFTVNEEVYRKLFC